MPNQKCSNRASPMSSGAWAFLFAICLNIVLYIFRKVRSLDDSNGILVDRTLYPHIDIPLYQPPSAIRRYFVVSLAIGFVGAFLIILDRILRNYEDSLTPRSHTRRCRNRRRRQQQRNAPLNTEQSAISTVTPSAPSFVLLSEATWNVQFYSLSLGFLFGLSTAFVTSSARDSEQLQTWGNTGRDGQGSSQDCPMMTPQRPDFSDAAPVSRELSLQPLTPTATSPSSQDLASALILLLLFGAVDNQETISVEECASPGRTLDMTLVQEVIQEKKKDVDIGSPSPENRSSIFPHRDEDSVFEHRNVQRPLASGSFSFDKSNWTDDMGFFDCTETSGAEERSEELVITSDVVLDTMSVDSTEAPDEQDKQLELHKVTAEKHNTIANATPLAQGRVAEDEESEAALEVVPDDCGAFQHARVLNCIKTSNLQVQAEDCDTYMITPEVALDGSDIVPDLSSQKLDLSSVSALHAELSSPFRLSQPKVDEQTISIDERPLGGDECDAEEPQPVQFFPACTETSKLKDEEISIAKSDSLDFLSLIPASQKHILDESPAISGADDIPDEGEVPPFREVTQARALQQTQHVVTLLKGKARDDRDVAEISSETSQSSQFSEVAFVNEQLIDERPIFDDRDDADDETDFILPDDAPRPPPKSLSEPGPAQEEKKTIKISSSPQPRKLTKVATPSATPKCADGRASDISVFQETGSEPEPLSIIKSATEFPSRDACKLSKASTLPSTCKSIRRSHSSNILQSIKPPNSSDPHNAFTSLGIKKSAGAPLSPDTRKSGRTSPSHDTSKPRNSSDAFRPTEAWISLDTHKSAGSTTSSDPRKSAKSQASTPCKTSSSPEPSVPPPQTEQDGNNELADVSMDVCNGSFDDDVPLSLPEEWSSIWRIGQGFHTMKGGARDLSSLASTAHEMKIVKTIQTREMEEAMFITKRKDFILTPGRSSRTKYPSRSDCQDNKSDTSKKRNARKEKGSGKRRDSLYFGGATCSRIVKTSRGASLALSSQGSQGADASHASDTPDLIRFSPEKKSEKDCMASFRSPIPVRSCPRSKYADFIEETFSERLLHVNWIPLRPVPLSSRQVASLQSTHPSPRRVSKNLIQESTTRVASDVSPSNESVASEVVVNITDDSTTGGEVVLFSSSTNNSSIKGTQSGSSTIAVTDQSSRSVDFPPLAVCGGNMPCGCGDAGSGIPRSTRGDDSMLNSHKNMSNDRSNEPPFAVTPPRLPESESLNVALSVYAMMSDEEYVVASHIGISLAYQSNECTALVRYGTSNEVIYHDKDALHPEWQRVHFPNIVAKAPAITIIPATPPKIPNTRSVNRPAAYESTHSSLSNEDYHTSENPNAEPRSYFSEPSLDTSADSTS